MQEEVSMKSRWVDHKGKRVFIAEFSGYGMDFTALRREADEIIAALQKEPPHSVRSISNVNNTTAIPETVGILKSILPATNKHVFKRAVIGVQGIRWYLLSVFNQLTDSAKLQVFSSLEEALDWIVED
jgi:hypothetical protein